MGDCATSGYGPIQDLRSRVHTAVDDAVDYFYGDWWKANEDDTRALDKSRPDRELQWSGPFTRELLLAGLASRWDDVTKLCSWVDDTIQWEPRFEMNDNEHQWFYVCVASELRPSPLPGVDELRTQIRQCRAKRPRLLCGLWDAIVAKDQQAHAAALKESLQHFLTIHADNVPNVNDWVALDESILCLIAQHRGLAFPKLPDKLDAAVVRKETIGL